MSVLFGSSLDSIQGSLSEERRKQPSSYTFQVQKLKKVRRLNQRYHLPLSAGPKIFYETLSEVSAAHPEFPLKISIGGLKIFEGKGSQRKILQLLMYLATLDEEWMFLSDILLERFVMRYYSRKPENLGKVGEETLDLLKVFGSSVIRNRYLEERYSERKLKDNIERGRIYFEKLYIRFFDASPIKMINRKRGYTDHGSLKAPHENHGEKERDETMGHIEKNADLQEVLLEIYKKATENYLAWLKKQSEKENNELNEKNNKNVISERNDFE